MIPPEKCRKKAMALPLQFSGAKEAGDTISRKNRAHKRELAK
jgi:hypothetical protein